MNTKKKAKPLVKGEIIPMGCGEKITVTGIWNHPVYQKIMGGLVVHISTPTASKVCISGKALKAIRELVDRAEATRDLNYNQGL